MTTALELMRLHRIAAESKELLRNVETIRDALTKYVEALEEELRSQS